MIAIVVLTICIVCLILTVWLVKNINTNPEASVFIGIAVVFLLVILLAFAKHFLV